MCDWLNIHVYNIIFTKVKPSLKSIFNFVSMCNFIGMFCYTWNKKLNVNVE